MNLARKSDCRNRHGAIIVSSGSRILGMGINSIRNEPYIFDDQSPIKFGLISEHAEIMALRMAKGSDVTGATIYVSRVDRNDMPALSKPCKNCEKALREAGIRKVVYTSNWFETREL